MRKCKIFSTFDANAILNFTKELKTASGKYRVDMVTWSFLSFAVSVILNLLITWVDGRTVRIPFKPEFVQSFFSQLLKLRYNSHGSLIY